MSPTVALFVWFVLVVALFYFDPAKDSGVSAALWVAVIWIFITGSRLPSQWLGAPVEQAVQALEEGNPYDRTSYSALTVLAIGILMSRSFKWGAFCARNLALTAFLSFALLSVLWSDFIFIAFKRWFRDLGTYLVILVALSDPRPMEAVRTLLRRLCYLLIPLSVLLIKYYPAMARQYDPWTGLASHSGATTSKNMLGVLCLISGLFFFWDTVTRWHDRKKRRTKQIILVNFAFLAMTLWLLNMSDSATSRVCLALGGLVIAAAHTKPFRVRPSLLKVMIPAGICLYLTLAFGFGFDLTAVLARAVGRSPNLTGRTVIWEAVRRTNTNPFFGTGYESFWLGPRLNEVWQETGPGINEAHNGYLEIYLNLGLIGLILLGGFLIASYRAICKRLTSASSLASLTLALWTILLFYNVTESAFKGGQLMWLIFLLGVIVVPQSTSRAGGSPAEKRFQAKSAF